jgi:hypothetical protein
MLDIDKQIEAKKKEIELLELKKQEAELNVEIKKIQNIKVEENIIIRRTIYRDEYVPNFIPTIPKYPTCPQPNLPIWISQTQGNTTLGNQVLC